MIYQFLDAQPTFDETCFIAPSADVIGDVVFGKESSAWFNVTIRGDVNAIRIGERTNIQDNACIHVMNGDGPTHIGNNVTVGHSAMIHGCTIHDNVLIGIHATILDKAVIPSNCIIAAGSLVPPNKTLETGYLYMGSPVKPVRRLSQKEIDSIQAHADNYVRYSRAYQQKDTYETNPFYDRSKTT